MTNNILYIYICDRDDSMGEKSSDATRLLTSFAFDILRRSQMESFAESTSIFY